MPWDEVSWGRFDPQRAVSTGGAGQNPQHGLACRCAWAVVQISMGGNRALLQGGTLARSASLHQTVYDAGLHALPRDVSSVTTSLVVHQSAGRCWWKRHCACTASRPRRTSVRASCPPGGLAGMGSVA
eukprot:4872645-Amphidinium_carterae.1